MTEILHALSSFDGNILLWIQEHLRSDFFTPFWLFVTTTGNGGMLMIAISCFLLAFKKTRKVGATCLIALMLSALFTSLLIKPIVARARPYEVIEGLTILVPKQLDFSFPSGHSSAAFAMAWVLFRSFSKKVGIPALVYALLMAFSRLYLGVHYPTDVIAGSVLGILYARAAMWLVERIWTAGWIDK